jgi:hypothetical protein
MFFPFEIALVNRADESPKSLESSTAARTACRSDQRRQNAAVVLESSKIVRQ